MPLTREQRNDAYRIYLLIGERDMPSNCTVERLVQRSSLPLDRVQAALDLLWNDDAGFIRVDTHPKTRQEGYYVDPRCRKKTPDDIDRLWDERQAALEEDAEDDEDDEADDAGWDDDEDDDED